MLQRAAIESMLTISQWETASVFHFTMERGEIVQVDVVDDSARLREIDLAVL